MARYLTGNIGMPWIDIIRTLFYFAGVTAPVSIGSLSEDYFHVECTIQLLTQTSLRSMSLAIVDELARSTASRSVFSKEILSATTITVAEREVASIILMKLNTVIQFTSSALVLYLD